MANYKSDVNLDDSFTVRLNKTLDKHPISAFLSLMIACALSIGLSLYIYAVFVSGAYIDRYRVDEYLRKLDYNRLLELVKALVFGLSMTAFTWMTVYTDSYRPGVNPPTPFSSKEIRAKSGHDLHFNYFMALLFGPISFYLFYTA